MKRNLIAVVLFGLASAQAGIVFADGGDVFADPFWARPSVASEAPAGRITIERTDYDQVDRYNP